VVVYYFRQSVLETVKMLAALFRIDVVGVCMNIFAIAIISRKSSNPRAGGGFQNWMLANEGGIYGIKNEADFMAVDTSLNLKTIEDAVVTIELYDFGGPPDGYGVEFRVATPDNLIYGDSKSFGNIISKMGIGDNAGYKKLIFPATDIILGTLWGWDGPSGIAAAFRTSYGRNAIIVSVTIEWGVEEKAEDPCACCPNCGEGCVCEDCDCCKPPYVDPCENCAVCEKCGKRICKDCDCGCDKCDCVAVVDPDPPAALSDAEFLQGLAASILKNGLKESQLLLSANNKATLILVIDGRSFVLATNVNNRNVSGSIVLPDGSGTLVFDIKGNGSNIKVFQIIKK